MRLVPKPVQERITFFQTHIETWSSHASQIGTSVAAVEQLADKTQIARDAFREQQIAQQQARAATSRLKMALDDMATAGASILLQVKAKAGIDGDNVYTLASIPAPSKGSPIAAPGKPTQFSTQLRPDGSLLLRWKSKNPRGAVGTVYQIWRSVRMQSPEGAIETPRVLIGTSGTRTFTDTTVPAGASLITYRIVPMRSTATGTAAEFPVMLGTTRAGGTEIAHFQTRRRRAA